MAWNHPRREGLSSHCVDSIGENALMPHATSLLQTHPNSHRHPLHSKHFTHTSRGQLPVHTHENRAQPLQVTHKHAQKGGPALQGFRKTHKRQHFRVVPWEKRTGHSKRSSWLCRAERRHTILRMPPKESTPPPKKGTRGKVDAAIEKN